MGSWLKFLMLAIQYGPQLVSLVSEIHDLIKGLQGNERDGAEAELQAAFDIYRRTKNRAPLRQLKERLNYRRFGRG